jgi:hypothetical protein
VAGAVPAHRLERREPPAARLALEQELGAAAAKRGARGRRPCGCASLVLSAASSSYSFARARHYTTIDLADQCF